MRLQQYTGEDSHHHCLAFTWSFLYKGCYILIYLFTLDIEFNRVAELSKPLTHHTIYVGDMGGFVRFEFVCVVHQIVGGAFAIKIAYRVWSGLNEDMISSTHQSSYNIDRDDCVATRLIRSKWKPLQVSQNICDRYTHVWCECVMFVMVSFN